MKRLFCDWKIFGEFCDALNDKKILTRKAASLKISDEFIYIEMVENSRRTLGYREVCVLHLADFQFECQNPLKNAVKNF